MTENPKRTEPLRVMIHNGRIVISIGVVTLAHAYAADNAKWDDRANDFIRTTAIEDVDEFARDVVRALTSEKEDGSSPLTELLDEAMASAVNDGSLGLHDADVSLKFGEFAPCEMAWSKE